MARLLFFGLTVIWLALHAGSALAQTVPPELVVTLRDAGGAPVSGVTVLINNADGSRRLAQALTDADGVASFTALAERQVRVMLVGTLADGTALTQAGDDAAGIRLTLEPRPATLALLSDASGRITPDPAAMAREPGGPPSPLAPASLPTGRTSAAQLPAARSQTIGLFAFALLIGVAIGMVVMQRRVE